MIELPSPEWIPSPAEYHADSAVSGSRLKLFMQSPHTYRSRYVDVTEGERRLDSESLRVGSCYSAMMQGREQELISVSSAGPSSSSFKTASAAAAHNGRTLVTKKEFEKAKMMMHVLRTRDNSSTRLARKLLFESGGFFEYAARYQHWSGVSCKFMVDKLIPWRNGLAVIEVKSAQDPSPDAMARQGEKLGYDVQCGMNFVGVKEVFGIAPEYWFVCQRNRPDWEVSVMPAGESYLATTEEVEEALMRLQGSLDSGVWGQRYELLENDEVPALERPRFRSTWRKQRRDG